MKILLKIDIADISNLVLNDDFDNALDNFFWEKEVEWPNFVKYKNNFSVRIIGNNQLSFTLKRLLKNFGFADIVLVNYPYLSDNSLNKDSINLEDFLSFDNKVSTFNIIADSYGNIPALIQLNKMFLDQEIPFLSLCVFSQIGYIGPFVVPKKTSCLHCFLSKLEQTQGVLNVTNASESEVFKWKKSLYPHPSVIESLAHFFTFQLFSHIRGFLEKKETTIEKNSIFHDNYCNNVTEVDLINSKIVNRFFKKDINCPSCCDLKIRQKIVFNFRNNYSL